MLTDEQLTTLGLLDKKAAIIEHPTNEHLHIIAEVSVRVIDTTPTNANPGISEEASVNLKTLLAQDPTAADLVAVQAMAAQHGLTLDQTKNRCAATIAKILNYIPES